MYRRYCLAEDDTEIAPATLNRFWNKYSMRRRPRARGMESALVVEEVPSRDLADIFGVRGHPSIGMRFYDDLLDRRLASLLR